MTELKLCDSKLQRGASPFDRILCLGYYDGPTSGLVRCAKSPKAYRFNLVAWDDGFEQRIYSLAETDAGVFDSIVQTLKALEEPRWPCWTPRWEFGSSLEENRISSEVDRALAEIPAASLLIASDHLGKSILACGVLGAAVRDRIPREAFPDPKNWEFWREYIGLDR